MTRVLLYSMIGVGWMLMTHQIVNSTLSPAGIVIGCLIEAAWTASGILAAEALFRRRRDR